jgi:hypothetical protein
MGSVVAGRGHADATDQCGDQGGQAPACETVKGGCFGIPLHGFTLFVFEIF